MSVIHCDVDAMCDAAGSLNISEAAVAVAAILCSVFFLSVGRRCVFYLAMLTLCMLCPVH